MRTTDTTTGRIVTVELWLTIIIVATVAGMRRCVLVPQAPHLRVASTPQSVLTHNH